MILAVIGVALAAAIVTYIALRLIRPGAQNAAKPPATSTAPTTSSTTTTLPQGANITAEQLRRLTADLVPFVESTRRLTFMSQPKPVLDNDVAFSRAYRVSLQRDDALMRRLETPFKVLGLNPNEIDMPRALQAFWGDKTVVFYDTVTNTLHVRETPPTPYLSTVLVVGLTEQLDDQHFTTDAMVKTTQFGDQVIGLRTLVQGDAWRVASIWAGTRSASENAQIRAEINARAGASADTTQVPAALSAWLRMPADNGVSFTTDLVTTTTSSPLDAAFKNPPDGSAQVAAVGRFQAPTKQLKVKAPAVDGKILAKGTFGQLYLGEVLGPVVSDKVSALALSGYRGDTLVAYEKDSRTCIRMDITTGSADPANMHKALTEWASNREGTVTMHPDALRKGRKVIRLDACAPGSGGSQGTTTTTPGPSQPSPSTLPGGRRNPA